MSDTLPSLLPRERARRLLAEPMTPAQLLLGLRGRIPRRTFWAWGVVAPLLLSAYITLLTGIAGVRSAQVESALNAILLWPALAVSVKRWHDRDKSGWWVLIQLLPVIGTLWALVENGFLRGTAGPNRYGDDFTGQL